MRIEYVVFGIIALFLVGLSVFVGLPSAGQNVKADLPDIGPAPELTGTQAWINSEPLTIAGLKGKVVLVDFWTYSCINCIRTLPYLNGWHAKYADDGLVIIGVHTPEFEFEKSLENVQAAIEKYGIHYAVVQDNDFATWKAYKNRYWPRKYLIDKDGHIRYDHIGEGGYDETEAAIRKLLAEKGAKPADEMTAGPTQPDYSQIGTPEIYLGYAFARVPLGNPEGFSAGAVIEYAPLAATSPNIAYLSGKWKNEPEHILAAESASLQLIYTAKQATIVAGGQGTIEVLLDGKPLAADALGPDVQLQEGKSILTISGQRLYTVAQPPAYGTHTIELRASPGVELYTFTFG